MVGAYLNVLLYQHATLRGLLNQLTSTAVSAADALGIKRTKEQASCVSREKF
jgi:hypothetical protein